MKVKVKSPSHVRLFTTPWTAAHQAPPSMGFSRQEYWNGLLAHKRSQLYLEPVHCSDAKELMLSNYDAREDA